MECEHCPYDDTKKRQDRFEKLYSSENTDWQPEYLYCDKVGGNHLLCGYC